MITGIRDWIDRYEHGPLIASLLIILTPLLIGMQVTYTQAGEPWWVVPVAVLGFLVLMGWVLLVIAATTRWFGRQESEGPRMTSGPVLCPECGERRQP